MRREATSGNGFRERLRRWWPALDRHIEWVVVGVFGLVLLAIAFRQPMSERVYPEARGQQLLDKAADALARGQLTAPDGSGARELYVAALALDPDRPEARVGLQRVGEAAVKQAAQAVKGQRFVEAHAHLNLARELAVPKPEVDRIAEELRLREANVAGIETMLEHADIAREAGRLDGDPDAALPLYKRVLDLQPSRNEALEGREDALSDLLQQAQAALAKRDFARAATLVERARGYDPGHVGLPDAQAALTQARDRERTRADRALRNGRLAEAGDGYAAAIALDANDAASRDGLVRTAAAWAARAERQAADFDFDEARASLENARTLDPQSPTIADVERRLAQSRDRKERAPAVPVVRMTPGRQAEVRRLIGEAAKAEARGDLLTPPGDSAYDYLRRARTLAPGDPSVTAALARMVPAARRCFDEAMMDNRLVRAEGCLDARVQLGDDATGVRIAKQRLALRWIAVGEERLRAGEIVTAQRALNTARALDPATEGLDAFAARINAATRAAEAQR
jgi:tetratricopeptide (TPR) repeat protein